MDNCGAYHSCADTIGWCNEVLRGHQNNDDRKRDSKWRREGALIYGSGSIFVGAVVLGWLVGRWIDSMFSLNGIGVAIGILIGFAAGAYEVLRSLSKLGE
jgi:F0F1-type ATP synthase assembly protein I